MNNFQKNIYREFISINEKIIVKNDIFCNTEIISEEIQKAIHLLKNAWQKCICRSHIK